MWDCLKQSHYRDLVLPIPQSNSEAAKQMRCAVIMAIVARTIDAHIFQPTYLLSPNSGIRPLLTRLAQEDSRRESALRALIQTMLSQEQSTAADKCIAQTCDDVMQSAAGVLPKGEEPK